MAAGKYNLEIPQGDDWAIQLTLKNNGVATDLTGFEARAQLRPTKSPNAELSATFSCTIIDAVNGIVKMELTNTQTSALTAAVYYYDLELYIPGVLEGDPDTDVTRILQGKVTIDANITRPVA